MDKLLQFNYIMMGCFDGSITNSPELDNMLFGRVFSEDDNRGVISLEDLVEGFSTYDPTHCIGETPFEAIENFIKSSTQLRNVYEEKDLERLQSLILEKYFPNGNPHKVEEDEMPEDAVGFTDVDDESEEDYFGSEFKPTYETDEIDTEEALEKMAAMAKQAEQEQEEAEELYAESQVQLQVEEIFGVSIGLLVNDILESYTKLFESGFQLKRPTGIIGNGVVYSLSGNELKEDKLDPLAMATSNVLVNPLGLTICPERSVNQIANILITGYPTKDKTGEKREGKLYFPLKMLEFAFGRERPETDNIGGRTNFGNVSKHRNWDVYAKKEIKPVLDNIFYKVATYYVSENITNLTLDKVEEIKTKLKDLVNIFKTCIVLSDHNKKAPDILRFKICYPYNKEDKRLNSHEESKIQSILNQDLAEKLVFEAYKSKGGKFAQPQKPIIDGDYFEYAYEVNHILYNAEPLFAFKASDAYKLQGKVIDRDHMLMGLQDGSKIIPVGFEGINLKNSLSHLICAGSRAGKGLQTLLLIANSMISGTPLFYLDNKPDMASLIKWLYKDAFVVNGADIATNKETGTDYFEMFKNPNSLIGNNVPEYVQEYYGNTYTELGAIFYTKALMLILGIISLRFAAPEHLDKLGGEDGIVVVVDELKNASKNLNALLSKGIKNIARTGFYQEYCEYLVAKQGLPALIEAWEANGQKGAKPKEPKMPENKPDKVAYWFSAFYKSLRESIESFQNFYYAGLKNLEAQRSDIFVLSQVLHKPSENMGELFANAIKGSNNLSSVVNINNNEVLASMCLIGEADGFIGYNVDKPNYLAQDKQESKAFGKLDRYARNFAYVPSVVNNGYKLIESGNITYAKNALYYKPFLILSDGAEDGYFVKNVLKYAEGAGINPEDILARNEDSENPGHIDKRVGFKEYLLDNGMTEQSIQQTLSKAGEIANFVLNEIVGYPGTWSEYVFDLRPEWLLSSDDIVYAYKNKGLKPLKRRLNEFTTVYPAVFGLDPNKVLPRNATEEEFDTDLYVSDSNADNLDVPFDETDDYINDSIFSSAEENEKVSNWEAENLDEDGNFKLETPQEVKTNSVENIVENLYNGGTVEAEVQTPMFGYSEGTPGLMTLVEDITKAISEQVGGFDKITKLEDIYGKLKINGSLVNINLSEKALNGLPYTYKQRVMNGLFSELFNFSTLPRMSNLRELTLISDKSLKDYAVICGAYNKVSNPQQWFFNVFNSLQIIKTENEVYRREEPEKEFVIEYEKQASSSVSDLCSRLRDVTWGYSSGIARNKDMGIMSKLFLGGLTAGVGALFGAASGGAKAFSGIKKWFGSVKEVYDGKR